MAFYRVIKDRIAHLSIGHQSRLKYLKKMINCYVQHLFRKDTPTYKSRSKYYQSRDTLFILMMILFTGCMEHGLSVDTEKPMKQQTVERIKENVLSSDSVQFYYDQARLGIGDAYVKMAQFYRDGTLGKPNLLKVMQMGFMAEEYMAIPNMDALFLNVSDGDVTKIAFQALNLLNHTDNEDILMTKADELLAIGVSDGYLMQAIIAWKKGKSDDAIDLCNKAIDGGSTFADVFKDIICSTEYGDDIQPETLLNISSRFPMAYRMLGDYYAKIPNDSLIDIPLARKYYLKASENACLGRREAGWVLETIYLKGYPAVDSLEEKRLWSLYRNEINDSVIWLP